MLQAINLLIPSISFFPPLVLLLQGHHALPTHKMSFFSPLTPVIDLLNLSGELSMDILIESSDISSGVVLLGRLFAFSPVFFFLRSLKCFHIDVSQEPLQN